MSDSFKAYDVRGIVGTSITSASVQAVGAAFVEVLGLKGQTVLVGGDMRPSSPEFSQAFAAGASSRGANVKLLSLISTDELYFASGILNAAGVVFTASHNPAEYNGMKMTKAGAVPLSSETGLTEIRDLAQSYLNHTLRATAPGTALVALREIARAKATGEERPTVIHNLMTSHAVPELICV